ncbi:MAG: deaminase [Catenulispora sp.]|nr:deaminase [Catenulispora sp.]
MRKVVVTAFVSLDGVAEEANKFIFDWDDVVDAQGAAIIATQDAVILGHRTYDEWSEYWPTSDVEPFATFINTAPKYVASSTPLGRKWDNTITIDGDLVPFVQDLKHSPGGDIGVHGSISVARALLAADVVDEVRLCVAPVLAGRGRRLLDDLPQIRLELLHGVGSPAGYLIADYRVSR